MNKTLRIALAQINLVVGDITGNQYKHQEAAQKARDELGADIIVFPELSLTGYPPEDLLLRSAFLQQSNAAFEHCLTNIRDIYCLIGHPWKENGHLFNVCSLIYNGQVVGRYAKQCLPNYGVFDECRYFQAGQTTCVVSIHGIPTGLVICEDIWHADPIQRTVEQGAALILIPNASPYEIDKHERRLTLLSEKAKHHQMPLVYLNTVGGQDELIFDGGSIVVDAKGTLSGFAGFFTENVLPIDIHFTPKGTEVPHLPYQLPSKIETIYQALVLSIKDYVNKNRFPGVLLGLSGGIDSALTLALAYDALGPERVHPILLPSRYTADISLEDAQLMVDRLSVKGDLLSIERAFQACIETLSPVFTGKPEDITEENIQARCRGVLLMALSNKFGHLVLTTGNRSEMAVGYCTLYGDMAGGFAVLKDVPKMLVYELANYRNTIEPIIPERIITRPPTAELAYNQKDEDSLPPYPILDAILESYLNRGLSISDIVAQGFQKAVVERIVSLIYRNEYKRRQAAIGPHINHYSFGKDWRYPITNRFKG